MEKEPILVTSFESLSNEWNDVRLLVSQNISSYVNLFKCFSYLQLELHQEICYRPVGLVLALCTEDITEPLSE